MKRKSRRDKGGGGGVAGEKFEEAQQEGCESKGKLTAQF